MTTPQEDLEHDMRFAEERLRADGELSPMMIFRCPDGTRLLAGGWANREEREAYRKLAEIACIAWDARSVTVMCDAWGRRVERRAGETDEETIARGRAVAPSEAEDRFEVVLVWQSHRDADGEVHNAGLSAEIERDADGRITGLKERDDWSEGEAESPWFDVLPKGSYSAEARRSAASLLERAGVTQVRPH